jgi:hypothetical protein
LFDHAGLILHGTTVVDKTLKAVFHARMKITEYKTATADSWAALDKEVNKLIGQGYQLYGSPYFGENKIEGAIGTFMVAQAMVKCGLMEKSPALEISPQTLIAP